MKRFGMIRLVRLYSRHFPMSRGKRLLAGLVLRLLGPARRWLVVQTKYGLRLRVCVGDPMYHDTYFLGVYEPDVTEVVRRIVRPGDTVFDVGANFGWYSVLCSSLVGRSGTVHSFEPVPWIFDELSANIELNPRGSRVVLNRVAVGESKTVSYVHGFSGLPHGHCSLSSLGRWDFSRWECQVITLDSYCEQAGVRVPVLIKCDVEGAELFVVQGSSRLLGLVEKPMWIIEMNAETSKAFGYQPSEVLSALAGVGYEFYRPFSGGMKRIKVPDWRHGDNLLCVVPEVHRKRMDGIVVVN